MKVKFMLYTYLLWIAIGLKNLMFVYNTKDLNTYIGR